MKKQTQILLDAIHGAMFSLENTLKKSEEYVKQNVLVMSEADFMAKSLAPDQFNFAKQFETALDNCTMILEQATSKAGRPKNISPTNFAEAFENLGKAKEYVMSISDSDFANVENVKFTFGWMPGKYIGFEERFKFTVANLYFHTVTAYSIARNAGVPLGKMDYLPLPAFQDLV